jgi:hypothetical protein
VTQTSISTPSQPRHRDYALVVLIALASRALTLLIAAAARFGSAPDGRLGSSDLASLLVNWDSGWYLRIIRTGYATLDLPGDLAGAMPHAYFPVFPLAVRAFAAATALDPVVAGVLLASLFFVGATCLVYAYARDLALSRETALAAVLLLCCAPHSFVFSALYAESTFLFLLAGAMLALRQRRFVLAGLMAALLSGTRPNGVLFVVFALGWTLRSAGWRALAMPWTHPWPALTIVLAPLGLVAYWWFCYLTTGDAFAQRTAVMHGWYWAADWPWQNLLRHLGGSSTDRFWAAGSLLYFAASLLLLRYRMFEEFAYCLASFLLVWSIVQPASLLRYGVVLFPIFVALARACAGRPLLLAMVAAGCAAINGLLAAGFALGWRLAV